MDKNDLHYQDGLADAKEGKQSDFDLERDWSGRLCVEAYVSGYKDGLEELRRNLEIQAWSL